MAYQFDVVGWEDWDYNQHWGKPADSDLPNVGGMFVHVYDPETGDSSYHWHYIELPDDPNVYWNWDNWYDMITGIEEDHGFAMA